jgi:hypothetical protein
MEFLRNDLLLPFEPITRLFGLSPLIDPIVPELERTEDLEAEGVTQARFVQQERTELLQRRHRQ